MQQPSLTAPSEPAPAPTSDAAVQQPASRSFAEIAAAVAALPGDPGNAPAAAQPQRQVMARLEPPKAAPKAKAAEPKEAPAAKAKEAPAKEASTKKPAAKEAAAKKEVAKKEEPTAKEPSRHWVQIAGGANEAAMNSEFKRLKTKAPKLLGTRTAWTTPLRATNRLLVGPFKTSKEAQEFVNELAKLDLSAFSWTSPAGQEITKLSAK